MKHLITLIISLFALNLWADNSVVISSYDGHPTDTVNVSIALSNTDNITALQILIPLDKNIKYIDNSCVLNSSRSDGHTVSAVFTKDTLKIYAYSLTLKSFKDNSGEILSFSLLLGNEPATYNLDMVQVKLSSSDGKAKDCTVKNTSIKILSPKLQITSDTVNFGHVPIRKQYSNTLYLKNIGTEPLSISSLGLFDANNPAYDPAEEEFRRRMQRKKKRRGPRL